jgi:hypothetical protein
MAGILDSKSRFIDLVVTQEGKRQIASGELRARFVSLSDSAAFYDKTERDSVSNRLYFEVPESPNNVIVIEKDDGGRLFDFNFSSTGSIVGNDIFDKDAAETTKLKLIPVTGSSFASTSTSLMSSFLTHFKAHQILGSKEDKKGKFKLSRDTVHFAISNTVPFKEGPHDETISVDDAEPFFFDKKLTHLQNFKFLPPINTNGTRYGSHHDFGSRRRESLSDIKRELGRAGFSGRERIASTNRETRSYRSDTSGDFEVLNRRNKMSSNVREIRQFQTVYFDETSNKNNLLMQVFEDSHGAKLTKLDIVDAGSFYDHKDDKYPEKRIFYVGKVYFDSFNTPTFINIFTIIFE